MELKPEVKPKLRASISTVLEVIFGSIFGSITGAIFVPMLAYSGYDVSKISYVIFFSGIAGIVLSYYIYQKTVSISKGLYWKTLIFLAILRISWIPIPFLIDYPSFLTLIYAAQFVLSIIAGIAVNAYLLALFRDLEDYMRVIVLRTALGSLGSLLGSIFVVYLTTLMRTPEVYFISIFTAVLIGLLSPASLLLYRAKTEEIDLSLAKEATEQHTEVLVRKVNVFLVLSSMFVGANISGIAWSPFLNNIGAPLYIATALNLSSTIAGIIAPYIWRGYKMYLLAMVINSITVITIPLIREPLAQLAIAGILSATFIGANLLASSVYAQYVKSLGSIKASTLTVSANALGVSVASLVNIVVSNLGVDLNSTYLYIFLLSFIFRLSAVVIAALGIPETAIVPPKTTYQYGLLISQTAITGYNMITETSRRVIVLTLQILALTFLIVLLYLIYSAALLLA